MSYRRISFKRTSKSGGMKVENHDEPLSEESLGFAWSFTSQEEAQQIDKELFNDYQFSVDQLMELAGLGVATAISKVYPLQKMTRTHGAVLVCCGPGNNGGDGLVAARHMKLFGYKPSVFYPRTSTNNPLYKRLIHQCVQMDIPIVPYLPQDVTPLNDAYELIVDAVFGFSFTGPVRGDWAVVLDKLRCMKIPVASIDIPSGWEVDQPPEDGLIQPDMLISLTAPKICAKFFKGRHHYLSGRFVPPSLANAHKLCLPAYHGSELVVELKLSGAGNKGDSPPDGK